MIIRNASCPRVFYQDEYNLNKVWEVVTLKGGYYLRQYIKGKQFGRGVRVTKTFLQQLNLLGGGKICDMM